MSALRKVTAAAAVTLVLPALYAGNAVGATPAPSPTPSPTTSATPTPTPTDSATPSPTPTDSATPSPSGTAATALVAMSDVTATASEGDTATATTGNSQTFSVNGAPVTVALSTTAGAAWINRTWGMGDNYSSPEGTWFTKTTVTSGAFAPSGVMSTRGMYTSYMPYYCASPTVDQHINSPAIGSEHSCSAGSMTFTFSAPVDNPTLSFDDLSGSFWDGPTSNWTPVLTLSQTSTLRLGAGVTGMRYLSHEGNVDVGQIESANAIAPIQVPRGAYYEVNVGDLSRGVVGLPSPKGGNASSPQPTGAIPGGSAATQTWGTGSGSVMILGTGIQTVTFDVTLTWFNASVDWAAVSGQDGYMSESYPDGTLIDDMGWSWRLNYVPGDAPSGSGTSSVPRYTLTYDPNGGACSAGAQTEDTGTWVDTHGASSCTRDGYTFLGWNTSAAGGGLGFTPGAPTQITGDNTLYAQWEEATPILAVDDADTTPYETPITDTVATNDTYPAGSTFTKVTDPANGTVDFSSNGSFTYRPNPGFWGTDSFDYKVCAPDSTTRCAEATQTITVPEPGDPAATPRRTVVTAGDVTPVPFSPNGSSRPAPGSRLKDGVARIAPLGTLNWGTRIMVPGKGTWRVADGEVTFTPLPSFIGKVQIRYQVQDANGKYADSTFTVITSSVPGTIDGGR